MKRLRLILVLILSISLTGCIKKYDLTEEQDDAVAEYMAGLLLEDDNNYDQELIPMEEIEADNAAGEVSIPPTSVPTETDTTKDNTTENSVTSKPQKKYTLSEVIGDSDFDIEYKDYTLTENPNDPNSYFTLNASEGRQFLVINFTITNISDKDKQLKLIDSGIDYQLDVNVGTIFGPEFTLLENDLHYIDLTIKAKESTNAVLVFQVPKDDISNMNLLVSKEDRSEIIEIK